MPEVEFMPPEPGTTNDNDGTLVATIDLKKAFTSTTEMNAVLKYVADLADKAPSDPTTEEGRKAIRSFAYKVVRSRTAIDDTGAALVERYRKAVSSVDRERKRARDTLDLLARRLRKPADDFEAEEARRVAELADKINGLYVRLPFDAGSNVIGNELGRLKETTIDDTWEPRRAEAALIARDEIARLEAILADVTRREAEAIELAKLREAEAARAAAAEAARIEAERQQALLARQQREAEIAEAAAVAARAAAEAEAAEAIAAAERQASEAAAAAEATRLAALEEMRLAEERRQAEAIEAAAAAERRAAEAAEAMRRQMEAEAAEAAYKAKAQADASAAASVKREQNRRLRAAIKSEMVTAIAALIGKDVAIGPVIAAQIAAALMDGQIPHCKVSFD